MYSEAMKKSLDLNRRFADSLSDKELDELMSEFDNYQVDENNWFYNFESFNSYLNNIYRKYELFSIFEKERKSINLEKDIKKDLIEGPFLFC
uniref:hypothetical protein n=1 Tax=Flavobacterium sp. TaxID=239 RepID=UPI00404A47FC